MYSPKVRVEKTDCDVLVLNTLRTLTAMCSEIACTQPHAPTLILMLESSRGKQ